MEKTLFAIFLLFYSFVFCDGAVTISPSNLLEGVAGQERSINCTFLDASGTNSLFFNENRSSFIDTAKVSAPLSVPGTPFIGTTSFLGRTTIQGSPVIIIRISFVLNSAYDGASLKCRFVRSGETTPTDSSSLSLRVFSSPCCNVSDSSIERNSTEQPSQLRLDCSDIIQTRGNPPANISWTVVSQSSGCTGFVAGNASQYYDIGSITRKCNNVKVICIADTKDKRLDITTKTFNLFINSVPGAPQAPDALSGQALWQAKPLPNGAGIEWKPPLDDGGFKVLDYQYTVLDVMDSVITSNTTAGLKVDVFGLGAAENYNFTVTARNALGKGSALTVPFSSPDVPGVVPNVTAMAISRREIKLQWTEPVSELPIKNYFVENTVDGKEDSTDQTSFVVKDLKPGTNYSFRVSASNGVGGGDRRWSQLATAATFPNGTLPVVCLTSENVVDVTSSSCTLKFDSATDAGRDDAVIAAYRVFLDGKEKTDWTPMDGNKQTHTIHGLAPNTAYEVQVKVINNKGDEGKSCPASLSITTRIEKKSGLGAGAIAGIAIGCILIVLGIAIIIFCVKKHQSAKDPSRENESAGKKKEKKNPPGGDGVTYAELELAQSSGPLKENRKEGPTQYSDVKPGYTYAELDLAKPSQGNEEKVKNTKEKESVPYTGVTKLATE